MKRLILSVVVILSGLSMMAQGRVSTRRYILADFSDKITKVVLPGNDLLDGALRQEVVAGWTLSPYEFCTPADFERLKKSADYYFLLAGASQFKGEMAPSLVFLTLVKGGPGAGEGTSGMHEVISLPLCPAGMSTGRELIYLGSLVGAIQSFTEAAMSSEQAAYLTERWFCRNLRKEGRAMPIWLSKDDIAHNPALYPDSGIRIVDEDDADGHFLSGAPGTLCSYVVAPVNASNGSWCYKMLFEAGTHRLFYLSHHKIADEKGPGFIDKDFRKIARARK